MTSDVHVGIFLGLQTSPGPNQRTSEVNRSGTQDSDITTRTERCMVRWNNGSGDNPGAHVLEVEGAKMAASKGPGPVTFPGSRLCSITWSATISKGANGYSTHRTCQCLCVTPEADPSEGSRDRRCTTPTTRKLLPSPIRRTDTTQRLYQTRVYSNLLQNT